MNYWRAARVVGLALTLVPASKSSLARTTPASPVRMTVAGDSLALGVGASDSSRGFAFDLFRRILEQRPGSEVTNLAIGGATTADVLRLEVPRMAVTHAQIVLVEAGANDAVRRHSLADFARDYRALVRGIVRAAPSARIVLFNVPDISVSPIFEAGARASLHRLALAYDAVVVGEGRRIGAPVIDLFAFSQRARGDATRYLSSDQFHPSDAGHGAIAQAAWPHVRALLAEGKM